MNESSKARRLYRSRRDRVIGGVCGGLGGYFNVDPSILRVVWLLTVLLGGTGLLAYLISWIIIPESYPENDPGPIERNVDSHKLLGVVLIALALLFIAFRFGRGYLDVIPITFILPLALIAIGIALLIRPLRPATDDPTPPPASNRPQNNSETDEADSKTENNDSSTTDKKDNPRLLRRSKTDKMLLGICGGIGKKYNLDSTFIRLIWILATVFGVGLPVIAYLVVALVTPEEEDFEHVY